MTVAVIIAGLLPIMQRYQLRDHAPYRGTHGRWDDHRSTFVDVRDSGRVSVAAATASDEFHAVHEGEGGSSDP
jgi:hypothetical protein